MGEHQCFVLNRQGVRLACVSVCVSVFVFVCVSVCCSVGFLPDFHWAVVVFTALSPDIPVWSVANHRLQTLCCTNEDADHGCEKKVSRCTSQSGRSESHPGLSRLVCEAGLPDCLTTDSRESPRAASPPIRPLQFISIHRSTPHIQHICHWVVLAFKLSLKANVPMTLVFNMSGQLPCSSSLFPSVGHKGKFPEIELLEFLKGFPEGWYSLQDAVISPRPPQSFPTAAAAILKGFSTTDSSPQTSIHVYLMQSWTGRVSISLFLMFFHPLAFSKTQQGS